MAWFFGGNDNRIVGHVSLLLCWHLLAVQLDILFP